MSIPETWIVVVGAKEFYAKFARGCIPRIIPHRDVYQSVENRTGSVRLIRVWFNHLSIEQYDSFTKFQDYA